MASHLRIAEPNPWNEGYKPDLYELRAVTEYYENRVRHYRREARKAVWQRRVRAFCLAVAVFCVLYFGGRELLAAVA